MFYMFFFYIQIFHRCAIQAVKKSIKKLMKGVEKLNLKILNFKKLSIDIMHVFNSKYILFNIYMNFM